MSRLLIVSNRLPVKVVQQAGSLNIVKSAGGLATGLSSLNTDLKVEWIGWPGISPTNIEEQEIIENELSPDYHPVFMSQLEEKNFYQGFSNEIVWPLFHCFAESANFQQKYWNYYRKINQRFAEKVLEIADEGDVIWVQDYHLMLLPAMLRKELPHNPIGFFLHIPFPSYELFRALPWRSHILKGLLGADLVGFHTYEYMRHFSSSVYRVLNFECNLGEIKMPTHTCTIDSFPMGINFKKFHEAQQDQEVVDQMQQLKNKIGDYKLILSVDRLDYTKNIVLRLKAFAYLLEKHPELREKISLVMLTVPSREDVKKYKDLKEQVDELVGRINGQYSTLSWTPVYYFYRSVPFEYLSALYNLSDIGLVVPLRDGMNLVAKEYVASKKDQKGVLILSEMAGAAFELKEALKVNPNSQTEIVNALLTALNMPEDEQKERMRKMQKLLSQNTIQRWAEKIIDRLKDIKKSQIDRAKALINDEDTKLIARTYQEAKKPLIILDYDGTLVSFRTDPQEAAPEKETLDILKKLSDKAHIVIISGRDHFSLDQWFSGIKLDLMGEHGLWYKNNNGEWIKEVEVGTLWKKEVQKVLREFTAKTPGSFIERKTSSLAFHYRQTDNFLSEMRIPQLSEALTPICVKHQLELLPGNKVLEIRIAGINKGTAVQKILEKQHTDFIMAIGDDRTDEDMFTVLSEKAFTIKVGDGDTAARYRVANTRQVKKLLKELAENNSVIPRPANHKVLLQ